MDDAIQIFLRGAWTAIPSEDDVSWVKETAKVPGSDEPLGDMGPLIKGMLEKGVSPYSIARFAKLAAYETAFNLCSHLEDPHASYEDFPEEDEQLQWGLFLVDPKTNQPTEPLTGLHESILSMDPSGRELRPKKKPASAATRRRTSRSRPMTEKGLRVYRVQTDPGSYKSLFVGKDAKELANADYAELSRPLRFDGKPKEAWIPPAMHFHAAKKPDPDFWHLWHGAGTAVVTVGASALQKLQRLLEKAGQLLPLPVQGRELTICNVLQVCDCIDPDRSEWRALPGIGERGQLIKPHFVPDRIGESSLFKIPQQTLTMLYCWERTGDPEVEFKACVETHDLTGLKFQLVWSES